MRKYVPTNPRLELRLVSPSIRGNWVGTVTGHENVITGKDPDAVDLGATEWRDQ
jgi:hypothetical protein